MCRRQSNNFQIALTLSTLFAVALTTTGSSVEFSFAEIKRTRSPGKSIQNVRRPRFPGPRRRGKFLRYLHENFLDSQLENAYCTSTTIHLGRRIGILPVMSLC